MPVKTKILQSTFDAVVKENVVDLELDPTEAIADAVEQFEHQNVDLRNIVTNPMIRNDENGVSVFHPVLESLEKLQIAIKGDEEHVDEIEVYLRKVHEQCELDYPHRHLAACNKAYSILMTCWKKLNNDPVWLLQVVDALSSLINGQPDLIESPHFQLILDDFERYVDNPSLCLKLLQLLQRVCTKHEANRQALMEINVIKYVLTAVESHRTNPQIVHRACSVLRVFTMDDDLRVQFGKAHDHARSIVVDHEAVPKLIVLMKENSNNSAAVSEILLTLSRLAVRNEFCQMIVDVGGLEEVHRALLTNMSDPVMVQSILALMKAISGNDEVKFKIVQSGGAGLIVEAMQKHQARVSVCEAGCATLAALALRCPPHCEEIVDAGGPIVILQSMKIHASELNLLKQACMAIRNLVARTKQFASPLLELGFEEQIRLAMKTHSQLEDEAKAALRDLGCEVELRELWTGTKGTLQN